MAPDPLNFLYRYDNRCDIEIAGLVASTLAYGRVNQIGKSIAAIMEPMGPSPRRFLLSSSRRDLEELYRGFRHRFTGAAQIVALLGAIGRCCETFGSMESTFIRGFYQEDDTVLPALTAFVKRMTDGAGCPLPFLIPSPEGGSACKRLHLYLRWMIRSDNVDPGVWRSISPSKLLVPLDTHLHRISLLLGLTKRRQADLKTALEVTSAFRLLSPRDPIRFDFALARLGMTGDESAIASLTECLRI